jgi:transcriptional regulator with XRE-family HTH domain
MVTQELNAMAKKTSSGFAAGLRALRQKAGLTQAQLAERAGMHLHGISKLEQGDREPSLATAAKLAAALGLTVDDLLQAAAGSEPAIGRGRPSKAEAPAPKGPARRKGM